ncbi:MULTISPECIES: hypothetical protein [unclassified Legionella]|uniref:hypothetical protein n=1 Tax=unclassified Legionella TaxID=2622702 RepID=UPI001054CC07|nr:MULTISPECIES: hypothetical protein [unclassified Legionella]MDI9818559.1 hypothetical protein [Legionella sp. PL877]
MKPTEIKHLSDDLEVWRTAVHDLVIPRESIEDVASQLKTISDEDFIDRLTQANELNEAMLLQTESRPLLTMTSIPVGEILSLLKDVYQGKMSAYLQEILSSAEIELMLINQSPSRLDSSKELEIKIKLAATVIDKYSGILQMIIGKKSLPEKDETIVQQAHQFLNLSTSRLSRINLICGISRLRSEVEDMIIEHQSSCCFSFLSFFSGPLKAYKALTVLYSNLCAYPLSEQELAGGLYLVISQMNFFSNKKDREALNNGINQLLNANHFPAKDMDSGKYIAAFVARVEVLKIDLPKPFILVREKTLETQLATPSPTLV